MIEYVIYGAVAGAVIGIVIVEYSWWRYSRRARKMIHEIINEIKRDEELKRKINELIDDIISYTIKSIKEKLNVNPHKLKELMERSTNKTG